MSNLSVCGEPEQWFIVLNGVVVMHTSARGTTSMRWLQLVSCIVSQKTAQSKYSHQREEWCLYRDLGIDRK
jgi:hypothetical protein